MNFANFEQVNFLHSLVTAKIIQKQDFFLFKKGAGQTSLMKLLTSKFKFFKCTHYAHKSDLESQYQIKVGYQ